MTGDRGQVMTLEAIIGGLVLLASVLFALQMTAVTPLSASTSSQHIENQLGATADGVLATARADGALERSILNYDDSDGQFVGSTYQGYYASGPPDTEFGRTLDRTFDQRGIAYNVYLRFDYGGEDRSRRMVYRGQPSDNAVRSTTTVVLTDDTPLYDSSSGGGTAERRSTTIGETEGFYAPDESPDTGLYNVVTVEVVLWRI